MSDTETLSETEELDGLDASFYNTPEMVSPESGGETLLQAAEKETSEISGQLEQSTTRELVLQELALSGRGEGYKIEERGTMHFSEDGKEIINEKDVSITKLILKSGNEEAIATHYESFQQLRDGEIVINKEQPGDEDPDTMHGSYMMLNPDGSISCGLTERKIERGEEEGIAGREEGEAPAEHQWAAFEHTEHEVLQFDDRTEVLAQLAAAQEADISRPGTVDVGGGEEKGEQAASIDIEALASPVLDAAETAPRETVEIENVLTEVAPESSGVEAVSISEFLHADPLESLPVFETPETTAHVPEAVVPDAAFSQAPQAPDIRETSMYQTIIALLKHEADAIRVSEKPDVEAVTKSIEETAEDIVMVPIEHGTESAPSETLSQPTEIAQATVRIEATTVQITPTEAPATVSRTEEKIDIATILRDTKNTIRIAPEVFQAGDDRKIDETGSLGVRPEALERQSIPNAHEIFLRTLGIREKTIAIGQERPYNTQRAGNPTVQFPSRTSTQPRGRTFTSKFGISLIEA